MDLSPVALRSLHEVAQRGTMTAAAEALGYSPAAVSLHISSLSRAVGSPVVEPAGRRVRLTGTGRLLLAHARRVLASEAQLERELSNGQEGLSGLLVIGSFSTGSDLVAEVCHTVRAAHPDLRIEVRELRETDSDNSSLAVSRSDVDIALDLDYAHSPIERAPDLHYRRIATERLGVVGLADGEGDDPSRLRDLAPLGWVIPPARSHYGQAIRTACRLAGFEPRADHVVTDTTMALHLVRAGLGICLASPLMMRFSGIGPELWRDLDDVVTRDVVAICRDGDRELAAVRAVLDTLAGVAGDLTRSAGPQPNAHDQPGVR